MEKLIKEAFIAGYEQGHNDTVESGYGCSPDKADEYYTDISNQVQAVAKPACGHKLTAKQFFIKQYQEGKCEDITTNPEPEFNNNFYLNIYKLMEDYSKSV